MAANTVSFSRRFLMARVLYLWLLQFLMTSQAARARLSAPVTHVDVNWQNVTMVSQTTATLQVVNNPMLNKQLFPEKAAKLFDALNALQADLIRYVP